MAEWVGKVAVFQRSLSFDHLTAVSGVGSSPALATCETSQVLLAGVSGGFPGVLPFRPPMDWLVSMSEIILKGTLNRIKKKKKEKKKEKKNGHATNFPNDPRSS